MQPEFGTTLYDALFSSNTDDLETEIESSIEDAIEKWMPYVSIEDIVVDQSNQLFVSRVLGLTGYDAGKGWAIVSKANYDPSTIVTGTTTTFTADFSGGTTYYNITNPNAQYLYDLGFFPNGPTLTSPFSIPTVDDVYPEGIVFSPTTSGSFSGVSAVLTLVTGNTLDGSISGTVTTYTATAYAEYDNLVLGLLRSRGDYFSDDGSVKTWQTSQTVGGLVADMTNALTNPLGQFSLSAKSANLSATSVYDVSLDRTSRNYITGVLGEGFFDRSPRIFVEEFYPNMLQDLIDGGYILGLKNELVYIDDISNYQQQFQTPETPWVVSELRGNKVFKLFKFISISDGDEANREIKISIQNIKFDSKEFDVIVRTFNDTDARPTILESYPKCNMDPTSNNFIARRIGTADGEFTLNSKFIMMVMNDEAPVDAFPSGFNGYRVRDYVGTTLSSPSSVAYQPPFIDYKTAYDPENERVRKVYLGITETLGIDQEMFNWKGLTTGDDYWTATTKGFHMDSGATIAGYFDVGAFPFTDDAAVVGTLYESVSTRKFTLVPYWGFDGWDGYRKKRTNTDKYRVGKTAFSTGVANGQFIQLGSQDGTSDLYAYWNGVKTFANPEAVNINVFATPGLDYGDNAYLVQEVIDMIEEQRADSVYILTSPENVTPDDSDPTAGFGFNAVTIDDADSLIGIFLTQL